MTENPIELHQFSHSHFNEKARWALDFKGVPHVRIGYLPGAHVPAMRRLSGQNQVPVLRMDGRVVSGSAAILDAIEQRFPEPALYPADPAQRDEALALERHFDETLGPEIRRAVFAVTLHDAAAVAAIFGGDKPAWKRSLFRAAFPAIRALMKKSMDITPETGRRSKERVDALLDEIAAKIGASGYLVGDRFSVADLTAAALLGPGIVVDHPDMARPRPGPAAFEALVAEWARHPAAQWAVGIYARHRPPRHGVVVS